MDYRQILFKVIACKVAKHSVTEPIPISNLNPNTLATLSIPSKAPNHRHAGGVCPREATLVGPFRRSNKELSLSLSLQGRLPKLQPFNLRFRRS